ncbi:MAG: hypothetical protein ACRDD8_06250 [Bacteroidales bacterium]
MRVLFVDPTSFLTGRDWQYNRTLDSSVVKMINEICEETGAKVVLMDSFGEKRAVFAYLFQHLHSNWRTDTLTTYTGDKITYWMATSGEPEAYAIVSNARDLSLLQQARTVDIDYGVDIDMNLIDFDPDPKRRIIKALRLSATDLADRPRKTYEFKEYPSRMNSESFVPKYIDPFLEREMTKTLAAW